jgi:hypothetical protein
MVGVSGAIGQLRQRVQILIDGDKVLPVDGSFLLTVLDRALDGFSGAGETAGRAAIGTFASRVWGLMEAGPLAAEDGKPLLEAAARLGGGLTVASDVEPQTNRRLGDSSWG